MIKSVILLMKKRQVSCLLEDFNRQNFRSRLFANFAFRKHKIILATFIPRRENLSGDKTISSAFIDDLKSERGTAFIDSSNNKNQPFGARIVDVGS